MKTSRCYACGKAQEPSALRPFGHAEDGAVRSWVCDECESPRPQPVESVSGGPALSWGTVTAAERLAYQGFGWSADHVMRRALEALERSNREEVVG